VTSVRFLTHNKVRLALHELRASDAGRPLLLLHGLGESSFDHVPVWAHDWPGAVHALDFTGHGGSTVPLGGGYAAEILLADADAALAALGECTVVGRGLGAYVALLLALTASWALALLPELPAEAVRALLFAGAVGAPGGVFRSAGARPVRRALSSSAMRATKSLSGASRRISISFTKPTST